MDVVHHLTYERIGNEELEDLIALCEVCHEFMHGKSDADPLSGAEKFRIEVTRDRAVMVNNEDGKQELYVYRYDPIDDWYGWYEFEDAMPKMKSKWETAQKLARKI